MPKFRFALFSHRNRPITDLVDTFILNGQRVGPVRAERDLKPTSKLFTVDAPADKYELQLEVDGFKLFRRTVEIKPNAPPVIGINLTHRCSDLPEFDELNAKQRALLATFNPGAGVEEIWRSLSDNQCATFFQLSHALNNIKLTNKRALVSYIDTVRRIGGAEIEDTIPDNKSRTATGWRFHVTIRGSDINRIVSDLTQGETFGDQDGFTHPTHGKFGLRKSHREKERMPRLQIVLSNDNLHADVDLDVEFDRSSPHDVFRHFIRRFPEVEGIYQF
jgi:hypothetical protein